MKVAAIKETFPGETRVAMTPESAVAIQKLGHACLLEAGAGDPAGLPDAQYIESGVSLLRTRQAVFEQADIIISVRPVTLEDCAHLRPGQTLISFVWPNENDALLNAIRQQGAALIAMDMIPRISRAQKMDALSSMANIAGYRAVIEAGHNFGRFFTGQITAAGKIPPAQVLVIGAGVGGLAAIGASVALGAVVRAFDVRAEAAEQVESMGAGFLRLDFDEAQDSSKTGGYAAPSSPEFIEKQMACFRQIAPEIDIVICTALIPGHKAPRLWLEDMVRAMRPGSVIVDLAAERGGNCDLTVMNEKIITEEGVIVLGYTDYPSRMATQSSMLYSNNLRHLLTDLTPARDGVLVHNMDDDVIRSATVVNQGEITFPPPPLKRAAIAPAKKARVKKQPENPTMDLASKNRLQLKLLGVGGALMLLLGQVAPVSFMQHLIVFALACFVGFQVIWSVNHALHTPLMAVTNAISGIIVLGAILQIGSGNWLVVTLAAISVLIATINIVGGFMVTRRMLAMFQKS
ncbi:Re/Si-specific NAD(P)(+) transhydrogenase subunit alpha [Nitrincola iocasae]|uniref:NAD(P) transhydrogenase subunit alpha n=1 Tax=Nitrincola iocasae TaxID=2614693 RepID=A0A5J6LDC5_9GAMM|nr:Re/Si-specific NAD(P)(+) transhydrogenase subunit alpha [Nitrincola iocasae]QEW06704.1 Re/Si-specific NAD(P)(+) transhydrogenase subunit alpha [Nitrincola iocasae]